MRSWTASVHVLAFALLALHLPAGAEQADCGQIRATPGALGYQFRGGDARCEGFYQSTVSAASLDLLSLTAGAIEFQLGNDKTVEIVTPRVGSATGIGFHVQARALPLNTYYRMDATIAPGSSMRWPIGHVLVPANLTADTIGVLAWTEEGPNRVLVPVSVSQRTRASTDAAPLVFVLRSSADLDELRWRSWKKDDGARAPAWQKYPATQQMLRAGGLARVALEPAKGTSFVEFAAKLVNSDRWLSLKLNVLQP